MRTQWLVRLAYNLLFFVGFFLLAPYYAYRLWRRGQPFRYFSQRFGWYDWELCWQLEKGADLWIHAVSVGEVLMARTILCHLFSVDEELRVVLTTTTQTGRRLASSFKQKGVTVVYNPVDFYPCVEAAFDLFRPRRLILIESEIWPNYLWGAKKRKIPVYLVNARLSPRTEARYRKVRRWAEPILQNLDLILAQDKEDISRLVGAGFPPESIFNIGSLKYDVAHEKQKETPAFQEWWEFGGWLSTRSILLGASTHLGEEDLLLDLYKKLRPAFPSLRLLLAPRHAERAASIQELCEQRGLCVYRRSESVYWQKGSQAEPDVLILDTTGELQFLYSQATLAFVGKSLRAQGGQNFIESTREGTPTIVGPNMQNFLTLTRDFVQGGGLIQVADEEALRQAVEELLQDEAKRITLGKKGKEIFEEGRGAAHRTAEIILSSLSKRPEETRLFG